MIHKLVRTLGFVMTGGAETSGVSYSYLKIKQVSAWSGLSKEKKSAKYCQPDWSKNEKKGTFTWQ